MSWGWPSVLLEEIFSISRGGSPRPIDAFLTDDPDGVNWVMIGDATESGKYINSTRRRITREGAKRSRAVKPGDFLLTNSMSFGRPYIMNTSGCIHDGWLVLSPITNNVSRDFFYHMLGSQFVFNEFARRAAGATVKNLNIDLVRSVQVPLPTLSEQRRIAAILDRAEQLLAKCREVIRRIDCVILSIFTAMFGDLSANRHEWPTTCLSTLVRDGDGINYGVVQPGDEIAGGIPLIRVADLGDNRVNHETLKRISPAIESRYKRSRLRGDEVLVSCVGSTGLVALADPSVKGFNIARAVARIPLSERVNRVFIATYLKTDSVQRYFANELRTVSQPTLNLKQLGETSVILPPRDLQNKFECRIAKLEEVKKSQQLFLSKLASFAMSLQHRAFRGEL